MIDLLNIFLVFDKQDHTKSGRNIVGSFCDGPTTTRKGSCLHPECPGYPSQLTRPSTGPHLPACPPQTSPHQTPEGNSQSATRCVSVRTNCPSHPHPGNPQENRVRALPQTYHFDHLPVWSQQTDSQAPSSQGNRRRTQTKSRPHRPGEHHRRRGQPAMCRQAHRLCSRRRR